MFRKKATPWVMAMTMIGMMGAVEAQTLEDQYFSQLPPIKRGLVNMRVNQLYNKMIDPLYPASDEVKSIYATGAKNAGAPYVEDIYTPPPDPEQHCRDVIAWSYVDNNGGKLNQSIEAAAKQYHEETGDTLYQFSYGLASTYYSSICGR